MLQMFAMSSVPVSNLPHSNDILPAALRLSSLADRSATDARVTGIAPAPPQRSASDAGWQRADQHRNAVEYEMYHYQPQMQSLPYSCSRQQSQIVMTQSRDTFCQPVFTSNNYIHPASSLDQQADSLYGYASGSGRTCSFHAGYYSYCSCQQMSSYSNSQCPSVATLNTLQAMNNHQSQQFNM